MITPGYARTMARYNRWMNSALYAAAAKLSDAERTLLVQLGVDPGVTDLIYLPGMEPAPKGL